MNYLIKNASVVNEGELFKADVLTVDGFIADIGRSGIPDYPGAEIIDASGKYLIPGIIDEHVHFRDPGLTHKADMYTESRSAVAGGVTSFMDMPNSRPLTVTGQLLEDKFEAAAQKSLTNYSFYIGATNDNLKELLSVDYTKVCGIKLFMGSSTGNMLVDRTNTLETLFREAPCLIAAHCEDEQIIRSNLEHYRALAESGEVIPDASIHPYIRTSEACYRASERAVNLADKTGARLHILHISTADELTLFRNDIPLAEKKITAETCPHYLLLSDDDFQKMGYAIKCNPSVKSPADRTALLKALKTGLIDTIGTDHAPHLTGEKFTSDYFTSSSGFPSIQHSLDLMNTLSENGAISFPDIIRLMCHNPAVLYRIDRRGFIRKGYHADLAIVDLNSHSIIRNDTEFTKCGWTPYDGYEVRSKVTHTFVSGNLVYENGRFHEEFRGERLAFNAALERS